MAHVHLGAQLAQRQSWQAVPAQQGLWLAGVARRLAETVRGPSLQRPRYRQGVHCGSVVVVVAQGLSRSILESPACLE
eukprot:3283075-Alexandrium_andersonii.AAC.1